MSPETVAGDVEADGLGDELGEGVLRLDACERLLDEPPQRALPDPFRGRVHGGERGLELDGLVLGEQGVLRVDELEPVGTETRLAEARDPSPRRREAARLEFLKCPFTLLPSSRPTPLGRVFAPPEL